MFVVAEVKQLQGDHIQHLGCGRGLIELMNSSVINVARGC